MSVVQIKSLKEYIGILEEFSSSENLLYRGQENYQYELIPSLARNDNRFISYESSIINHAKSVLPDVFKDSYSPIDLLSIMQHYGLPTRLLDLTDNALVALFFACQNITTDGEIIVFQKLDCEELNQSILQGIADTNKLCKGDLYPLDLFYDNLIQMDYFDNYNIIRLKNNVIEKEKWIYKLCREPRIVKARLHTIRQRNQGSYFLLFPNLIIEKPDVFIGRKYFFLNTIKEMKKDDTRIMIRIIVNKNAKVNINENLKKIGITSVTVFPDDIDKICKYIANMYI